MRLDAMEIPTETPEVSSSVKTCAVASVTVSVKDVEGGGAVASTEVVVVFPDREERVTTNTEGKFKITVDLSSGESLDPDTTAITVHDSGKTEDTWKLGFPVLQRGDHETSIAYFGACYYLKLKFTPYSADPPPVVAIQDEGGSDASGCLDPSKTYRLIFTDPYSVGLDDADFLDEKGDRVSRPDDYGESKITNIQPWVYLEAAVTKKRNGLKVDITKGDDLSVRWGICDPPPTYEVEKKANNSDRAMAFLDALYKKYQGPSHTGKNCPRSFGGVREDLAGVKAVSVLFEEGGGELEELGSDPFLCETKPTAIKHGVARFTTALVPPPIGGDSYRVELALRCADEAVPLMHPVRHGEVVEKHRSAELVLWRKLPIVKVCYLGMHSIASNVWEDAKEAFAAAYIELDETPRDGAENIQGKAWMYELKSQTFAACYQDSNFPTTSANMFLPDNALDYYTGIQIFGLMDELTQGIFAKLYPGATEQDGFYVMFCKNICKDYHLVGEWVGDGQLFVVEHVNSCTRPGCENEATWVDASDDEVCGYCKDLETRQGEQCEYHGCSNQATCVDEDKHYACNTCIGAEPHSLMRLADQYRRLAPDNVAGFLAHELAHGLYLRHSVTKRKLAKRNKPGWGATGTETRVKIMPPDFFYDHDPGDAVSCLMSYCVVPPDKEHFCAVCLLKLRLWDTVKMANDDEFKKMVEGAFVKKSDDVHLVFDVDGVDPPLLVDRDTSSRSADLHYVHALTRPDDTLDKQGFEIWQELAWEEAAEWSSDDANKVAFATREEDEDWQAHRLNGRLASVQDPSFTAIDVAFKLNGVTVKRKVQNP